MRRFLFSVIAKPNGPSYDAIKTGDKVELAAVDNNIDPYAIEVRDAAGVSLGWAANAENTVIKGTMSATELQPLIKNPKVSKTVAYLRAEKDFVNAQNLTQRRWIAEAFFVPLRANAAAQQEEKFAYNVGGTSASNPKKSQVMGMLAKAKDAGTPIDIDINVSRVDMGGQSQYLVYLPNEKSSGSPAGEITDANAALDKLFEGVEVIKGKVSGLSSRSSYSIELVAPNRAIDAYFPLIDTAIENGIGQANELEKKASVMVKSGFSESAIRAVFEQMPPMGRTQNVPIPKVAYTQKSGTNLFDAVSYMLMGKTVRLVGEKGSGKNTLVETACWLLNRPLCRVQGSSELDKLDILGSRTLTDGSMGFELSSMLTTLRDDGVVVVDEANMVRPDVLSLLHSLTDGARSIDVPGYGPVKMGPHACIMYTLNEDYVGTGEMNPATIDRGPSLIISQESDMAEMLKTAVPDADPDDIAKCVSVSASIQKAAKESGTLTSDAITVRGYIDALQSAKFIPLRRALIQNVANKAQTQSERTAMETIISGFFA